MASLFVPQSMPGELLVSALAENSITRIGQTSVQMAAIRARASESPDSPYFEPMARIFADSLGQRESRNTVEKRSCISPHVARHMMIDKLLYNSLSESCHSPKQVVILGAGMETRAYRLGESLPAVKWFEVDLPEIVRLKEETLASNAISVSRGGKITRIGLNLESDLDQLLPALKEKGFEPCAPAAFVMEGLVYYMEPVDVARLWSALPTVPTSCMIVSVMREKTRNHFKQGTERAGKAHLWKRHLEQLRRQDIFPPPHWKVVHEVRTNSRGARRLDLRASVPRMSFPASLKCPPECIFTLESI